MSDLATNMRDYAQQTGQRFSDRFEPSLWLRSRLADMQTRLDAGSVAVCPHLRAGDVGVMALWAPDAATCTGCQRAVFTLEGAADRTCDRCGVVGDKIHPEIVSPTRHVLVMLGLCPSCHVREMGGVGDE